MAVRRKYIWEQWPIGESRMMEDIQTKSQQVSVLQSFRRWCIKNNVDGVLKTRLTNHGLRATRKA